MSTASFARGGLLRSGVSLLDKNVERMLAEPWGAPQAGAMYNTEVLESLCEQFSRLQPQARRGALQATLFMRRGLADLQPSARRLVDLAAHDSDQWVGVIAHALAGLKERFDLCQLQKDVPAVADALRIIREKITEDGTPDTYRPLEEMYLSPRLLAAAGAPPCEGKHSHGHFTLRERREPKKRQVGGVSLAASRHSTQNAGFTDVLGDTYRARSSATTASQFPGHRRPVASASTSMFAPPSRKHTSAASFLRDAGPRRTLTAIGAGRGTGTQTGKSTRTMMIDIDEAKQLGTTASHENLQKKVVAEDKEKKRQKEQEEKERRLQRVV